MLKRPLSPDATEIQEAKKTRQIEKPQAAYEELKKLSSSIVNQDYIKSVRRIINETPTVWSVIDENNYELIPSSTSAQSVFLELIPRQYIEKAGLALFEKYNTLPEDLKRFPKQQQWRVIKAIFNSSFKFTDPRNKNQNSFLKYIIDTVPQSEKEQVLSLICLQIFGEIESGNTITIHAVCTLINTMEAKAVENLLTFSLSTKKIVEAILQGTLDNEEYRHHYSGDIARLMKKVPKEAQEEIKQTILNHQYDDQDDFYAYSQEVLEYMTPDEVQNLIHRDNNHFFYLVGSGVLSFDETLLSRVTSDRFNTAKQQLLDGIIDGNEDDPNLPPLMHVISLEAENPARQREIISAEDGTYFSYIGQYGDIQQFDTAIKLADEQARKLVLDGFAKGSFWYDHSQLSLSPDISVWKMNALLNWPEINDRCYEILHKKNGALFSCAASSSDLNSLKNFVAHSNPEQITEIPPAILRGVKHAKPNPENLKIVQYAVDLANANSLDLASLNLDQVMVDNLHKSDVVVYVVDLLTQEKFADQFLPALKIAAHKMIEPYTTAKDLAQDQDWLESQKIVNCLLGLFDAQEKTEFLSQGVESAMIFGNHRKACLLLDCATDNTSRRTILDHVAKSADCRFYQVIDGVNTDDLATQKLSNIFNKLKTLFAEMAKLVPQESATNITSSTTKPNISSDTKASLAIATLLKDHDIIYTFSDIAKASLGNPKPILSDINSNNSENFEDALNSNIMPFVDKEIHIPYLSLNQRNTVISILNDELRPNPNLQQLIETAKLRTTQSQQELK